jgi:hypothetical protein
MWNFSIINCQPNLKIGYVYQWINNITYHKYIGSHNGKKSFYLGSGLAFKAAIKKYGIENFTRQILYIGPKFREVEEEILILLNVENNIRFYNMKNQALGGIFFESTNGMKNKTHSEEAKNKISAFNKGKKKPEHSKRMTGNNNPMFQKNFQVKNAVLRAKENTGKTLEEIYGFEKAQSIKTKLKNASRKQYNLKEVVCTYCNLIGKWPNMSRYHFSNCKKLNE